MQGNFLVTIEVPHFPDAHASIMADADYQVLVLAQALTCNAIAVANDGLY
jgi:hypothetical protein